MKISRKSDVGNALIRISQLDTGEIEGLLEPREMLARAVEHMSLHRHQYKLENWVLQNFFFHYNRLHAETFQWTTRGKPPNPDYLVFTQPNSQPLFVEVTELLDPSRKRGDEYKLTWEEANRTGDYLPAALLPPAPSDYEQQLLDQALACLEKKFSKQYPLGTWLVVYFNPKLFTPGWTNTERSETLRFAVKILSRAANMLRQPDKIKQVWVLTNDGHIERIVL